MLAKCVIDRSAILKKGMTVTLRFDEKETVKVLQNIGNLNNKPLNVDFAIDQQTYAEIQAIISPEQRAKAYVLFRDIANQTGDNEEAVKHNMKYLFRQAKGWDDFSLSDCSKELAHDFITFIISWCFIHAVDLKENPKEILNDLESWLYLCMKYKQCAVCRKEATIYTINGGKIALCDKHAEDSAVNGWNDFKGKYHVEVI